MVNFTDEALAKAASEKGVTPLAHELGVKLSDTEALLDEVVERQYFAEMAKHGHVPRTKEEAAEMIKVALDIQEYLDLQETSESREVRKQAAASISELLGQDAPEATAYQQAVINKIAADTAGLLSNPEVVAHLAARYDAGQILGN